MGHGCPRHDTGVAKEKTALFTPGNTQDLLEAVNDIEDRDDSEVFMSSQPEQSMSKKQLKKLKGEIDKNKTATSAQVIAGARQTEKRADQRF